MSDEFVSSQAPPGLPFLFVAARGPATVLRLTTSDGSDARARAPTRGAPAVGSVMEFLILLCACRLAMEDEASRPRSQREASQLLVREVAGMTSYAPSSVRYLVLGLQPDSMAWDPPERLWIIPDDVLRHLKVAGREIAAMAGALLFLLALRSDGPSHDAPVNRLVRESGRYVPAREDGKSVLTHGPHLLGLGRLILLTILDRIERGVSAVFSEPPVFSDGGGETTTFSLTWSVVTVSTYKQGTAEAALDGLEKDGEVRRLSGGPKHEATWALTRKGRDRLSVMTEQTGRLVCCLEILARQIEDATAHVDLER